jgi:hypothetical protein
VLDDAIDWTLCCLFPSVHLREVIKRAMPERFPAGQGDASWAAPSRNTDTIRRDSKAPVGAC